MKVFMYKQAGGDDREGHDQDRHQEAMYRADRCHTDRQLVQPAVIGLLSRRRFHNREIPFMEFYQCVQACSSECRWVPSVKTTCTKPSQTFSVPVSVVYSPLPA